MLFSFFPSGFPSSWESSPVELSVDNLLSESGKASCRAGIPVGKVTLGCRTHASEQTGIHGVLGSCSPHCSWWQVLSLFTACALLQAKRSFLPVPLGTGTSCICAVWLQKMSRLSTCDLMLIYTQNPPQLSITAGLALQIVIMGSLHVRNRFFFTALFLLCIFSAIPAGFSAVRAFTRAMPASPGADDKPHEWPQEHFVSFLCLEPFSSPPEATDLPGAGEWRWRIKPHFALCLRKT